jgi:hypothetical protein
MARHRKCDGLSEAGSDKEEATGANGKQQGIFAEPGLRGRRSQRREGRDAEAPVIVADSAFSQARSLLSFVPLPYRR